MKVILTGATGMVGVAVLHECLLSPEVTRVLAVSRKHCGMKHEKLQEIIVPDLMDVSHIAEQLGGYDACFFCAGVSSLGMDAALYEKLTYTLTIQFCKTVVAASPGIIITYVSGVYTDSTENGRVRWARVKGRTENELIRITDGKAYAFRPGMMQPTPGVPHVPPAYKYIGWLYPIGKALFKKRFNSLAELGRSMIRVVKTGFPKNTIEVVDILKLAAPISPIHDPIVL